MILPRTAQKNGGKCMPCATKARQRTAQPAIVPQRRYPGLVQINEDVHLKQMQEIADRLMVERMRAKANADVRPQSAESTIPQKHEAELRSLRDKLAGMSLTPATQAFDELESRNAARQRVWGEQVEPVSIQKGDRDATYQSLLGCLTADFANGASHMDIEEVNVVADDEASSVQQALDKLSETDPRIASDPGARAYYQDDLAKRLRKHRRKQSGDTAGTPTGIRKITVKVHFRGSFGLHDILRVSEDCYYLMPCTERSSNEQA